MPEGWRPRGVTPRPRSGAAAESTRLTAQERLRRATPRPRSGGAAGRSYPMPLSQRPGAAARRSNRMSNREAGAVAWKTNPTSKEPWLRGCRRA